MYFIIIYKKLLRKKTELYLPEEFILEVVSQLLYALSYIHQK